MAMRLAAAAAFVRRLVPARPPVPVLAAASTAEAEAEAVTCGRGDKKTKRGKRFKGSYGNARPKREKKIERIKDRVEVPRSTPWPLPFKLI
ncbi:small ribosomal subunit protein bTHXm [Miscanthus floridulus]|uniref:small ribosomal subunit protein bTHXm n=1 Tax=Miscanthus floridulus TaxID=154761 RepID=UPI00345809B5